MVAVPSIGRASLVEPRSAVAAEASATHDLYERHAAKIHSYCLHQLGSREEAEDAVQTTFMNAFRALRKGVVPETELAWLFKIAENVCLSRRRSSWRRNRIESPADFGVIEEIVPGPNRQRDELIGIEDALASMPEQQRRAILLREWQGLSYREIGEELELSQSAVETLIFRARRSLAQGLTEPESTKPKRKNLRRALRVVDVASLLGLAKTLFTGAAAVKATTAAVAVTALAGGAATVAPKLADNAPKQARPVVATTPAAPAAVAAEPAVAVERKAVVVAEPKAPVRKAAPARRAARPASAPAKPALTVPEPSVAAAAAAPPVAADAAPAPEPPKSEHPKAQEPKADEPKSAHPKPAEPKGVKPKAGQPKPKDEKEQRGNGRGHAGTPDAKAAEPERLRTPAAVTSGGTTDAGETEKQGRGHAKRGSKAPETAAPELEPVLETAPVVVETSVAPSAEETESGKADNGRGKEK